MKRYIAFLLILSGCTSDHYTPVTATQHDDIMVCRHKVYDNYAASHQGAAWGGAVLGPIGSVMGASIDAPVDQNIEMEKCMKTKGYIGTSDHYN